jgi:prepilin-type processing-associated H-X9-DG protein
MNQAGTAHYAMTNNWRTSYYYLEIGIMEDKCVNWTRDTSLNRNMFGINGAAKMGDIIDGTSTTLMLCESPFRKNASVYGPYWLAWVYTSGVTTGGGINRTNGCGGLPATGCPTAWGAGSKHEGGMQIVMADGSVRFINENINTTIYSGLVTIAGGEAIDDF